jgi:hypothetical protein
MAAELQVDKEDSMKQPDPSLSQTAPQCRQWSQAEEQQQQERLERAYAEYKQLKEGQISEAQGNAMWVQTYKTLFLFWLKSSHSTALCIAPY